MNPAAAAAREQDEQRRLAECSQEPIRTPGAIQSHGILLGVDPVTGVIVVASANAERWLGRTIAEAGSDAIAWAVETGVAVDPVRLEFDGSMYDVIVHRGGDPVLVEFEPIVPSLEYVRTGVVTAIQRLAELTDADELRAAAARELRDITGFDRVMVYHFHEDGHGQVVAEERADDMESYEGLHFPASDIPAQARQLYLSKISRAIVSTTDAGTPLLSLLPDAAPLDLGATELRSVSPHHLEFMRNMGQASTVSFSLVVHGELIGMITCAHRTERRLPILLRRSIEVLANQVSMQLASIAEIERLRHRLEVRERRAALLAPLYGSDDIGGILLDGTHTVLDLVPADGVYLRLGDTVRIAGDAPPAERIETVVDALGGSSFVSEAFPSDHPELAVQIPGVTGLLVVPLGADGDCIAFLRGEVTRVVRWLGDQSSGNRPDALSPRRSFAQWEQSVTGRSLPWGHAAEEAFELGREIESSIARRDEARLAELAMRDSLTGLHNRRFLMERLEGALGDPEAGVALLFVDLDEFKHVNDSYGHDAGDAVIVEVARRLTSSSRSSDIVVRLGGDEFVIVCLDVGEDEAAAVANRTIRALADPVEVDGTPIAVTASCGVAVSGRGLSAAELLDAADAAMYRAKRAGRNRVSA